MMSALFVVTVGGVWKMCTTNWNVSVTPMPIAFLSAMSFDLRSFGEFDAHGGPLHFVRFGRGRYRTAAPVPLRLTRIEFEERRRSGQPFRTGMFALTGLHELALALITGRLEVTERNVEGLSDRRIVRDGNGLRLVRFRHPPYNKRQRLGDMLTLCAPANKGIRQEPRSMRIRLRGFMMNIRLVGWIF